MGDLLYTAIASLDGYVSDADGDFEWAAPDESVHSFVNDLERPIGTYLYGRRLYEAMRVWDDAAAFPDASPVTQDFAALWQAADKIVYSTTLSEVSTRRTRIERTFAPDAIRRMKDAAERDITVGGATLAGHALAAGLVDECRVFVVPEVVGGGTAWLPDGLRRSLTLLDERRFDQGVVFLRYRVRS